MNQVLARQYLQPYSKDSGHPYLFIYESNLVLTNKTEHNALPNKIQKLLISVKKRFKTNMKLKDKSNNQLDTIWYAHSWLKTLVNP